MGRARFGLAPVGRALPIENGVLLVLSPTRRMLDVDLDDQRVVVETGVTNIAVSHAVAPDFFYPPDPASQIVCSIGGNVAKNSGVAHSRTARGPPHLSPRPICKAP